MNRALLVANPKSGIKNNKNIDIGKLKRNFLTNSSCGVCGKTSLDSIEVIKNGKLNFFLLFRYQYIYLREI